MSVPGSVMGNSPSVATVTRAPPSAQLGQRRLVGGWLLGIPRQSSTTAANAAAASSGGASASVGSQPAQPAPQRTLLTPSPQQPVQGSTLQSGAGLRSGCSPMTSPQPLMPRLPPLPQQHHPTALSAVPSSRQALNNLGAAGRPPASAAASTAALLRQLPGGAPECSGPSEAPANPPPAVPLAAPSLPPGPPRLLQNPQTPEHTSSSFVAPPDCPLASTMTAAAASLLQQPTLHRPAPTLVLRPSLGLPADMDTDSSATLAAATLVAAAAADGPGSAPVWSSGTAGQIASSAATGTGAATPSVATRISATCYPCPVTPLSAPVPPLIFAGSECTPPSAFFFTTPASAANAASGLTPSPAPPAAPIRLPAASCDTGGTGSLVSPGPRPNWPLAAELVSSSLPVLALPGSSQSPAACHNASGSAAAPAQPAASISLAARLTDPIKALEMVSCKWT